MTIFILQHTLESNTPMLFPSQKNTKLTPKHVFETSDHLREKKMFSLSSEDSHLRNHPNKLLNIHLGIRETKWRVSER